MRRTQEREASSIPSERHAESDHSGVRRDVPNLAQFGHILRGLTDGAARQKGTIEASNSVIASDAGAGARMPTAWQLPFGWHRTKSAHERGFEDAS